MNQMTLGIKFSMLNIYSMGTFSLPNTKARPSSSKVYTELNICLGLFGLKEL
jgi:hypothetical protein